MKRKYNRHLEKYNGKNGINGETKASHSRTKRVAPMVCLLLSAVFLLAGCGKGAPESVSLQTDSFLLTETGATLDLNEDITISGENADNTLLFESSDPEVAEVSENGVVTAKGEGGADIKISSKADPNVSTSAYVLVYDISGTYQGKKYIDAMGCDIEVRMELKKDGTVSFWRGPMNVALEGGGEMPELKDSGTYRMDGAVCAIEQEFLGGYKMDFKFDANGTPTLSGMVPTGGAPTQMQLEKQP